MTVLTITVYCHSGLLSSRQNPPFSTAHLRTFPNSSRKPSPKTSEPRGQIIHSDNPTSRHQFLFQAGSHHCDQRIQPKNLEQGKFTLAQFQKFGPWSADPTALGTRWGRTSWQKDMAEQSCSVRESRKQKESSACHRNPTGTPQGPNPSTIPQLPTVTTH